MDANTFDALAVRLRSGGSRRAAMRALAGGALAVVGVASATAVEGKGEQVSGENWVVGNRKRIFCLCREVPENGSAGTEQVQCETRRVKTKKFRKLFRKNPNSYRGPCQVLPT